MDRRVEGLKDLRGTLTYTAVDTDPWTREERPKVLWAGAVAYRSPGRLAWAVQPSGDELPSFFPKWIDRQKGIRGALDEKGLVLQIPFVLHVPEDFGGLYGQEHHGATYYRAGLDSPSPATFPLLARPPLFHPAMWLLELAPRQFLARLPGLKLDGKRQEGASTFYVLTTGPADPRDETRIDESRRMRDKTWLGGEIWIDATDYAITQVVFRYEDCAAAPRHRFEFVFKFSRRIRVGGGGAIATVISHGSVQMVLTRVAINSGVNEEEMAVTPPPEAIVRDWIVQPAGAYEKALEKAPGDAAGWLNLASVRYRHQDFAGALAAFQKVIETRPAAPEGYIGMAYLLKERTVADAAAKILENPRGPGGRCPVVHLALAHWHSAAYRSDPARHHFEEVLKAIGEDPKTLENMTFMLSYGSRADFMNHFLRTFRAELTHELPTFAYTRWGNASATPEERLVVARLYEEAVSKGDTSLWIRTRLIDLYRANGRREDARRHAAGVVAQIARESTRSDDSAADHVMEFFVSEKDFENARKLREIFSARGQVGERQASLLETEIVAARADAGELKRFLDDRVGPEWNPTDRLRFSFTYVRFMRVLKREKRIGLLAQKLLEALRDDASRAFYVHVLEDAIRAYLPSADAAQVKVRLKEKLTGTGPTAGELLSVGQALAYAKRWKEAADKAKEVLGRANLAGGDRARAEMLLAECHQAFKEHDKALEACDRALRERDIPYPLSRGRVYELRARVLLERGDPAPAVVAYAQAFREHAEEKNPSRRWTLKRALIEELRKRASPQVIRKGLEEALQKEKDGPAYQVILAVVHEREGRPGPAAEAFAAALLNWRSDPVLLRELLRARTSALQIEKAVQARAELLRLWPMQRNALRGLSGFDPGDLNGELVRACELRNDPALLRSFAETLAAEEDPSWNLSALGELLLILREEPFIEKIHALLMKSARDEGRRFGFRFPAAYAYHGLGRTDKAVALYREIAEGKGNWGEARVASAREWIGVWEKEAGRRVDVLAILRKKLEEVAEGEADEVARLEESLKGYVEGGYALEVDRAWRAAVRGEKPDPFFCKLGALRGRPPERLSCLERLLGEPAVRPEWHVRYGLSLIGSGQGEKGMAAFLEALKGASKSPPVRDRVARLLWSGAGRLGGDDRKRLALAMAESGAYRWAWELRDCFLTDAEATYAFALKWRTSAAPGEDRSRAGLVEAQALVLLERPADALEAAKAALGEPGAQGPARVELENLRLRLLTGLGLVEELAPAILKWLGERRYESGEIDRVTRTVLALEGERLNALVAALDKVLPGEAGSPGLAVFRARLEMRARRPDRALKLMEEAARRAPEDTWFLRDLGEVRMAVGDFKGAADAFEAVLRQTGLERDLWGVRINLLRCYARSGRPDAAVEQLRALEAKPVLRALGPLAEELGLYEEAIRLYREVLREGVDTHTRLAVARSLLKAKRLEEAETEYRAILKDQSGAGGVQAALPLFALLGEKERGPRIAEILFDVVGKEKNVGQARLALETLELKIPPESRMDVLRSWEKVVGDVTASPIFALATARMHAHWAGAPGRGADVLLAAEKKAPSSAWLPYEAAGLLSSAGRPGEAALAYERAAERDPEGKEIGRLVFHVRLSALREHQRAKDFAAALRVGVMLLADVRSSTPEESAVRSALGAVVDALGEGLWTELRRLRPRLKQPERKSGEDIARLVELLSDDDIEKRTDAAEGLKGIGTAALPSLIILLDAGDVDLRATARRTIRSVLR